MSSAVLIVGDRKKDLAQCLCLVVIDSAVQIRFGKVCASCKEGRGQRCCCSYTMTKGSRQRSLE